MGVSAAAKAAPAAVPAVAPARPPRTFARIPVHLLQRACDCGGSAGTAGQCEACGSARLMPERLAGGATPSEAPPSVYDVLRSPGRPLEPTTRAMVEPRLGRDFSQVRIHTGPAAEASARAVHARAYTVGNDLVFGAGQYAPGTQHGNQLLAHELTHVVQQSGARADYPLRIGPANDVHEHAAHAAAQAFTALRPVPAGAVVQRRTVQRQGDDTAPAQPSFWDRVKGAAVSAAGTLVDAAGNAINMGADFFLDALGRVAPSVVPIVQGIRQKGGIIPYLKDLVGGAFRGIFGRLANSGGFVGSLVQGFAKLLGTAREIITALAHNDCKPLFDAIGRLGDAIAQMAGDAWDKIKEFFAPIGDFFSDLWQKFGAPAVDFLGKFASDVWEGIKAIGSKTWSMVLAAKDALGAVFGPMWTWVKNQLGIGEEPEGQDGLLQWVQRKLGEAWDFIKAQLDPVVAPIKAVVAKISAVIPLDKIMHLRETVHEWLAHAGSMVKSLQKPQGVTDDQASLREKILPAIKAAIVKLGVSIAAAGSWASAQMGGVVQSVVAMIDALKSNPIIGAFAGAIDWLTERVNSLAQWVEEGVVGLFGVVGGGVAKLSNFVDPVLGVLEKLVAVIANVVKALPDLVLGPVWKAIPQCLKDPIKKFVIEHILSAIPVISTFLKVPEIWGKIEKLVMNFLSDVFVKGDLGGAALRVIRFVLEAIGVNVDLFLNILANAAEALDDIIMHPMKFLSNLFGALKQGTAQFLDKIGSYLISGLLGWLLESVEDLGVTAPKPPLTVSCLLDLVLQILGITTAKLRKKVEAAIGEKAVSIIEKAWEFVSALITGGFAGLWEQIKAKVGDLWGMVIGGLSGWITKNLIEAGLAKLVKLSNPAGAIIEALQTIYKTLTFIVQKVNKILALVDSVVRSIGNIAAGKIDDAAKWIEGALARSVQVLIGFFMDWLGFGDPGPTIRDIVEKIQAKVDAALDWLVAKAVAFGRAILSGLGIGDDKDQNPKWAAGVEGVNKELDAMKASEGADLTADEVRTKLPQWKTTYGFSDLSLREVDGEWEIDGAMSPGKKVAKVYIGGDGLSESNPIIVNWTKPALGAYKPITLVPPAVADELEENKKVKEGEIPLSYLTARSEAFPVEPIAGKTLADGTTIGVTNPISQTGPDFLFKASTKVEADTEKERFKNKLAKWGYNRESNLDGTTDADHVMEKQLGGPDHLSNLWPLNSAVNQRSGTLVRGQISRIKKALKTDDLNGRWVKLKF
jgi:hypothetical protein